ncbi:MAG: hypothetical protein H6740_12125 [Alphaproteobacteria bacterium]|nr:hypothetical protein [Alphaproteobacteria bacterium]
MLRLSELPPSALEEICSEDMTGPAGVGWSIEKMNSPFGKSSQKFVSFFSRYPDEQVTFSPDPALERASRNLWPSAVPSLQSDLNALHAQMVPAVLGLLPHLDRAGRVRELDCTAYALRDRRGQEHQVVFSEDEFIITSGDALVIESAGYVPATPHTVRIPSELPKDVRRLQSVSFIDPLFEHRMHIPTGESFAEIIARDPGRYAHRAVDTFEDGCYFRDFYEELLRFLYK